ncbi:MAG: cupin domain-containing protein [Candidatus Omnitrophota bacterium]|jgi:cupin 2 domain-containing protein
MNGKDYYIKSGTASEEFRSNSRETPGACPEQGRRISPGSFIGGNLFKTAKGRKDGEIFDALFVSSGVKIERIISLGQTTAPGKWLKQSRDEWVLLLKGAARLKIGDDILRVKRGDYLFIPADLRHRVEWTRPAKETVWLAVYLKNGRGLKTRENRKK